MGLANDCWEKNGKIQWSGPQATSTCKLDDGDCRFIVMIHKQTRQNERANTKNICVFEKNSTKLNEIKTFIANITIIETLSLSSHFHRSSSSSSFRSSLRFMSKCLKAANKQNDSFLFCKNTIISQLYHHHHHQRQPHSFIYTIWWSWKWKTTETNYIYLYHSDHLFTHT